MNLIKEFAEAIKIHEGWFAGSRSQRNHNPGNLKYVKQAKAIGSDSAGFAIFANDQDGWDTLIHMIENAINGKSKIYYPEMTILQFFEKYAPSADKNNPQKYAEIVAFKINKDINFKIKNLEEEQQPPQHQQLQLSLNGKVIFSKDI